MERIRAGRYIKKQDTEAIWNLEPGDYMLYQNEAGENMWIAKCPNSNNVVNLMNFQPQLSKDKLTCGLIIRTSNWAGTLNKGIWTWEE